MVYHQVDTDDKTPDTHPYSKLLIGNKTVMVNKITTILSNLKLLNTDMMSD
jgi:hypothetical protein